LNDKYRLNNISNQLFNEKLYDNSFKLSCLKLKKELDQLIPSYLLTLKALFIHL